MSRDNVKTEEKAKQDSITSEETKSTMWGALILEAETQIKIAQRRIADLRKSIRYFSEQEASNKPFPVQK